MSRRYGKQMLIVYNLQFVHVVRFSWGHELGACTGGASGGHMWWPESRERQDHPWKRPGQAGKYSKIIQERDPDRLVSTARSSRRKIQTRGKYSKIIQERDPNRLVSTASYSALWLHNSTFTVHISHATVYENHSIWSRPTAYRGKNFPMKTWQVLYIPVFLFSICFYVKGINVTLNITGGTIYLYMFFLL